MMGKSNGQLTPHSSGPTENNLERTPNPSEEQSNQEKSSKSQSSSMHPLNQASIIAFIDQDTDKKSLGLKCAVISQLFRKRMNQSKCKKISAFIKNNQNKMTHSCSIKTNGNNNNPLSSSMINSSSNSSSIVSFNLEDLISSINPTHTSNSNNNNSTNNIKDINNTSNNQYNKNKNNRSLLQQMMMCP